MVGRIVRALDRALARIIARVAGLPEPGTKRPIIQVEPEHPGKDQT